MDAVSVVLADMLFDEALSFMAVSSQRFESSPYGLTRYIKYSRLIIISSDTFHALKYRKTTVVHSYCHQISLSTTRLIQWAY